MNLGVVSRGHQGPRFGEHVGVAADEYDEAPGFLVYSVGVDVDLVSLDVEQAHELVEQLAEAAAWVETHQ